MASESPPLPLAREAALVGVGTLLLLALFFAPALTGSRVIYSADFSGSDLLEMNVPRRALAAQAVRQGNLPHWTPLLGNGYPLLAEGQSGIFYPTTLPLFLALPLPLATNLTLLSTLGLALVGGYILARTHGVRPGAAALTALAWGLGAVMVLRLKHVNLLQVIAWLPASLACVEALIRSNRGLWALLVAGIWALQILAGHPHAAYLCGLGVIVYFLARLACGEVVRPVRAAALLAGAALMAVALAAIQGMPTAELVQVSLRGRPFSWEEATAYPFRVVDLLRLVHPFAGGNPAEATVPLERLAETGVFWESHAYLGLIPLALAVAAPFLRRDRSTAWLAAAALLCLVLALGRSGGLYWLAWRLLPGFSLFRFPARFLILFAVLAALLAGLGAESLLRRLPRGPAKGVAWLLVLLTTADLYRLNACYQGYLPAEWFQAPATVALLGPSHGRVSTPTADQTWQRVYLMAGGWRGDTDLFLAHRDTLAPDASALWGVAHHSDRILQEGGIELVHYANLQKRVRSGTAPAGQALAFSDEAVRLLERQNVTHLLSFFPLAGTGLQLVASHQASPRLPGPLFVYRTSSPVPRIRMVGQALPAGRSEEAALDMLGSKNFDPWTSTLLETLAPQGSRGSGQARMLQDRGDRMDVEVDSTLGGFLVVLDNWHPAWKASVDGVPEPVLRADVAFRAVRVQPGRHLVRFQFTSAAFAWGAWISLASLTAWTVLLTRGLRARSNQPYPTDRVRR